MVVHQLALCNHVILVAFVMVGTNLGLYGTIVVLLFVGMDIKEVLKNAMMVIFLMEMVVIVFAI